jgi:hypothetical protein
MTRIQFTIGMIFVSIAATFGGSAWPSHGQDGPKKDQPKSKKADWLHDLYLRDASDYSFFLEDRRREELELRREPVMRWTSDNDYNGEVYIWTHQGAAAIVGCIFSGPRDKNQRSVMHEFHSLSPNPISSGGRGESGWHPQEPGVKLESIPDAPAPATSPARRLAQMRDLTRRFTAQVWRENSKWEMRLLTQPLYRYEITDEKSPIVDGGVFCFVWTAGTDPEVLLILEARRTDKGEGWFYAPARFTNCEAWLQYHGKEVWRAEPSPRGIFDGVTTTRYGAFQVKAIPNRVKE